jgi:serine/threonine protein phosphatase PrpC
MPSISALCLEFAAATDIGCQRSSNEDSFGYDLVNQLYVVCDGMGGSAAGEVASGLAVQALIESFVSSGGAGNEDEAIPSIEDRLLRGVYEANRAVYQAALSDPQYSGMGTTMVLACLDGDRILIGNVGDSRAYRMRDGVCVQITLDHSLIDEQLRSGMITPEMAATSEMKSVITRAVGVGERVEPDFFTAVMQPDDLLLLASDGLTRYAAPEDIYTITHSASGLTEACRALVDYAKNSGGVDNITCILLCAVGGGEESGVPNSPDSKPELLDDLGNAANS